MAISIVTRAKKELIRQRDRAKALKERHRAEAAAVQQGASVLVGAALAALVDEKFAAQGSVVAEVHGVPTNALVGLGAVGAAALVKGMPFRAELAAAGLGAGSTALYQFLRDNVDFS